METVNHHSIANYSGIIIQQVKYSDSGTTCKFCANYYSQIYIIGASLSEPHTSKYNGGIFIYIIYISVVRRSVNQQWPPTIQGHLLLQLKKVLEQLKSLVSSVTRSLKMVCHAGQESILCEGECCQGWIHRTCAGLSKRPFQIARESADFYLCHYCSSLTLQREIKQLKQTVSSLQAEVESLRSVGNSPEITAPPSPGINQDRAIYASVTNTGQSNPTSNPSRVTSNTTTTMTRNLI